jgi:hypothetical protein
MKAKERRAKVKATGMIVLVYALQRGGWCNSVDCKTEYKDDDLEFLN